MTTGPIEGSAVEIRGWGDEMQLVAASDVAAGALLIGEYPIAFAETGPGDDERGPWMLVDMILGHPAVLARVQAVNLKLTKWTLGAEDEDIIDRLADRHGRKPKKVRQLYHQVAANNIRYQVGPVTGFGIWPNLSRSNHSCAPNARLAAARHEPLAELLLALRPIARGEPVTWNYFSDDAFIRLDWLERNRRIQRSFQFLCRCERCESEKPAELRHMSRAQLVAHLASSPVSGA